jgi:hypothetical protein
VHDELYKPAERLDDPSYHLVSVATWLQHGDLRMPKFQYGDRAPAFYPIAGELIDWSLVAPLRDSDFLARWAQLPFLAALLTATAALALRQGAGAATTALAMLLLLTVRRLFPDLAMSAANDVMAAFFFAAAADALLALGADRAAGRRGTGAAVYLGAAVGLLVGTKYLGLLLALPLLAILLPLPWLAAGSGDGVRRWRRHFALVAVVAGVAAVAGGYTYLRNAVTAGNPLFPLPLSLGPWHLPGWTEATLAYRRHLPEFALDPLAFLLVNDRFTGRPFVVSLLPAAVAAPLARLAWRRRASWRLDAAVLALPAALWVLFLLRVHDHRDVRYLFAAFAVAAAAFAWLAQRLTERRPRLRGAVLAGGSLLAFAFLVPGDEMELGARLMLALGVAALGAAGGLATAVGPGLPRLAHPPRRRAVTTAAAVLVVLLAAAFAAAPVARRQPERKYADDAVVQALEQEAPEGTTVAVVGGNRWYRLFGPRLRHHALAVPRHGPPEAAFYTWGGDVTFPYDEGDYQAWRRNLAATGARWVVTHPEQGSTPQREWMRELPRDFHLVASAEGRELWRRGRRPRAGDGLQSAGDRDVP